MANTSPRLALRGFPYPKVDHSNEEEHRRELAEAIGRTMRGDLNARDTVTLTESATSTVVTDERVNPDSFIDFMPETANAAVEKASGGMYVSSRGEKTFTITHNSKAQSDLDFTYLVIG